MRSSMTVLAGVAALALSSPVLAQSAQGSGQAQNNATNQPYGYVDQYGRGPAQYGSPGYGYGYGYRTQIGWGTGRNSGYTPRARIPNGNPFGASVVSGGMRTQDFRQDNARVHSR